MLSKANEIREESVACASAFFVTPLLAKQNSLAFFHEKKGDENNSSDGERARPSGAAVKDLVGDGLDRNVLLGREGQGLDGGRRRVLAVARRLVERELAGAGAAVFLKEGRVEFFCCKVFP